MTSSGSPLDTTPRNSPPVSQTSNLTSQLQAAGAQQQQLQPNKSPFLEAHRGNEVNSESFGNAYGTSFHSRPIAMAGRDRRESNNYGSSHMNGMSWGGLSVGSFIRDDILMAGTSPYNFQSPSFHSSSYLPKMEANFMKDYVCCGITLDSLHELLQHYEEAHAGVPNQTMGRTPKDQQTFSDGRTAEASTAAALMQQQSQHSTDGSFHSQLSQGNLQPSNLSQGLGRHTLEPVQDIDDLDAMEMDDQPAPPVQSPHQYQPQPQFGRQQPRAPSVNTNVANAFNSQRSTPSTPQPTQSFNSFNNPTVSSVNTPTFGQTAGDGTTRNPGDLELDSMDTPRAGQGDGIDFSQLDLGRDTTGTIDEPAKRLLSKQGFGGIRPGLTASQFPGNNNIGTQLPQGMNATGFGYEEVKPFKCPVIGCEKAYKNQNGLKYHKQHGHQNQQLKENPDGSFSIVDPATSIPYPGTVGMEKEKPYRCEVCGKRYKNLNGLKYHRQHSPPCNPDLKLGADGLGGNNLGGANVNVAGAGLVSEGLRF